MLYVCYAEMLCCMFVLVSVAVRCHARHLFASDRRARWCGKDVFTRSSRKCYPPRQKLAFSCIRVCFSVCTALTGRTWTVRALFCSIRPWTTKKCYLPPQSVNFRHAAGERKQKRLDDCFHAIIISFPSTNILKLIVVDVAGVSKAIVMIIRQTRLHTHTHTISEPWSRSATDLFCGSTKLENLKSLNIITPSWTCLTVTTCITIGSWLCRSAPSSPFTQDSVVDNIVSLCAAYDPLPVTGRILQPGSIRRWEQEKNVLQALSQWTMQGGFGR